LGGNRATIRDLAQKMQRGEAPPPPIGRLLGFVLKVIEPARAVFQMEGDERHHNQMGTPHGGVYGDLADAAMAFGWTDAAGRRPARNASA
jgi:acyl-coenzyme A thioesterase PaaI-like protein